MLGILILKELRANLLTLRLLVALVCTLVLAVLTSLIGSLDYSERLEAYRNAEAQARQAQSRVTVYSQLELDLLFPPQPLSILCRGVSEAGGYHTYIRFNWIPALPSPVGVAGGTGGDLMKTLVQVDFATVVVLVLSFLAVVLGFDGICGERERGTLSQLLVNPVPRSAIVLAKLAGGLLSLWLPFALALVLALLILQANPDVAFAAEDWLRLLLFFALSCLFLGQVFALTLMVSTLTRHSATSLIACLFAWLIAGVGYLNLLPSLARYGVEEEPTFQETLELEDELWKRCAAEVADWEARHPAPPPAYMRAREEGGRLRYGHPQGYAWRQRRNAFALEKQVDAAEQSYQLWWAHLEPLAREALLVDRWSILSPFTGYQVLSYQLARTTIEDRFHLGRQGLRFRQAFVEYLRAKRAFSSRQWFTDDREDQEPMIPNPEEISAEMLAPDSPFMHQRLQWVEQQEQKAATRPRLDLADLPRFSSSGYRPLPESLAAMTPGLAVLLFTFGAGVLLTLRLFAHYDPR